MISANQSVTTAAGSLPPRAVWNHKGTDTILELSGDWHRDGPAAEESEHAPGQHPDHYEISSLGTYDSTLPAFLLANLRNASTTGDKQQAPVFDGLPDVLQSMLKLALAVPEDGQALITPHASSDVRELGKFTLKVWSGVCSFVEFTGQSVLSLGRLATGHARFRASDFWLTLEECGAKALPIVSLISFLIGSILAFVGNVQLANFGANLFVADLVGIAMVREMGAVMTAIIMCGRTGAAFAANLGSMKANEEIDALRTFGLDPFDFLVLPRLLALVLMMPILTVYANIVGILGGMLVGFMVGIPPILYWTETLNAVDLTNFSLGVFKSVFFGATIAISGCLIGLRAGNSAAAVGQATTSAVVASITIVIVLDSGFAAIFTLLDI